MENERPIEKLLRRFAKQRRQDSGAPRAMHPATRRLLQGEVTRQFPRRPVEKAATRETSLGWWLRWDYALFLVAAMAVGGALLLPSLSKSKSKAQFAKMEDVGQVEGDEVLRRNEIATPASASAPTESVDRLDAPSLEEKEVAFAKVAQSPASPQRFSTGATATISGAADSSGEKKREFADSKDVDATRQKQDVALFSNAGNLRTRSAVLNSFQVEQVGNELRVIDEDGSTYSGNLQAASVPIQSASPTAGGGAGGGGDLGKFGEDAKKQAKAKNADVATDQMQSSQNYYFRVSGFNNTLRQNVVFEGNLIATNQTVQSQPAAASTLQLQNFQFFINNSVIIGRAQVEKEQEIEIKASPVGP